MNLQKLIFQFRICLEQYREVQYLLILYIARVSNFEVGIKHCNYLDPMIIYFKVKYTDGKTISDK